MSSPRKSEASSQPAGANERRLLDLLRQAATAESVDVRSRRTNKADSPSAPADSSSAGKFALEFLEQVRVDQLAESLRDTGRAGDTGPATTPPAVTGDAADPLVRKGRFDRFEVLGVAGRGGFADVYVARDPALDREVALKVLRHGRSTSDEVNRRFEREARAAALLDHPNIVAVFETGEWRNQRYIVTGLCHGPNLHEWLTEKSEPVPLRQAAAIVAVIANAVEHAHRRGIVHRDLKPANILIDSTEAGADSNETRLPGRLMVSDFGLARLFEQTDQRETGDGAVLGTPAYMAPEQARGEMHAGTPADIWSLGAVFYELLTGQLPFQGESSIDTLLKIARDDPVPPSRIRSTVNRDLQAICLRCLAKDPNKRYSSAGDLARDLERWLRGEPVLARPAGVVEKSFKWCRRNPVVATSLAAVSVALVIAVVECNQATLASSRAERNTMFAGESIRKLATQLTNSSSVSPDVGRLATLQAIEFQTRLLQEDPDNKEFIFDAAKQWSNLGTNLHNERKFDESLEAFHKSMQMLDGLPDVPPVAVMKNHNRTVMASSWRMLGRYDQAMAVLEIDVDTANMTQLEAINYAGIRQAACWNLLETGDPQAALAEVMAAECVLKTVPDPEHIFAKSAMATTWRLIAVCQHEIGNNTIARETIESAWETNSVLAMQIPFHADHEEEMGRTQRTHASILAALGEVDEAAEKLRQAAARFEFLVEWDPRLVRCQIQLFDCWSELLFVNADRGDFGEHAVALERLQTLFEDLDPENGEYVKFGIELIEHALDFVEHQVDKGQAADPLWLEVVETTLDRLRSQDDMDVEVVRDLEARLQALLD